MQLKKICPVEWFVFALIVGFVLTMVGVWSKTIWLIALGFIILGTCVVLLVRFVYKGYKIMRTLQDDPVDSFLGDYH